MPNGDVESKIRTVVRTTLANILVLSKGGSINGCVRTGPVSNKAADRSVADIVVTCGPEQLTAGQISTLAATSESVFGVGVGEIAAMRFYWDVVEGRYMGVYRQRIARNDNDAFDCIDDGCDDLE